MGKVTRREEEEISEEEKDEQTYQNEIRQKRIKKAFKKEKGNGKKATNNKHILQAMVKQAYKEISAMNEEDRTHYVKNQNRDEDPYIEAQKETKY